MKYLILALAALGMFSCTSSKNVAQNNSKQRTIASFQQMGFNDSEATALENEIAAAQNNAGAKKISPLIKFEQYSELLRGFTAVANSSYFSTKQKVEIMKADTRAALTRLNNQTGGSGLRYMYFKNKLDQINSLLGQKNPNPQAAAQAANEVAPDVYSTIKSLGY
jgi:hypothetical protein